MSSSLVTLMLVAALMAYMRRKFPDRISGGPTRVHARPVAELPGDVAGARRTTIAEARDGELVAIIGRVVGPGELRAPLSGRACVAYDTAVHEHHAGRLVLRELRAAPFLLEDATGRARVEPRGAFIRLVLADHYDAVQPGHLPGRPELARIPAAQFLTGDEGVVEPGSEVLVVATASVDGGEAGYREPGAPPLLLASGRERSAMISNQPGDPGALR